MCFIFALYLSYHMIIKAGGNYIRLSVSSLQRFQWFLFSFCLMCTFAVYNLYDYLNYVYVFYLAIRNDSYTFYQYCICTLTKLS